jgi:hypothetical protein
MAMSVMLLVVGALAALTRTAQQSFTYNEGRAEAAQHARVTMERIERMARESTANEQFPGFLVVAETVATWRFPDVLVVWHPGDAAANPAGLPRFCELVIYCPDRSQPNRLVEITVPNDTRTVPAVSDQSRWQSEIAAIRGGTSAQTAVLTDLMRTCAVPESTTTPLRGAVRFETRLRPSDSDWARYKAGTLAWKQLPWAQGISGGKTGLRQAWVRMEIQLMPGDGVLAQDPASYQPIAFFGSAACYYDMNK